MNKKDELINNIEKRLKTTMIGAIAKFEKNFAYLWESDTINREKFEDLWDETRNEILNNGNQQIRSAVKELSDFLYGNNPKLNQKYNYKFYFRDHNGDSYEN
jgi:hypothetical protein